MINEYKPIQIEDFRGLYAHREATDIPHGAALAADNCEFTGGSVSTRYGFAEVWNPNVAISGMYNWITGASTYSADGNWLIYYDRTASKVRYVPNLAAPVPADLYAMANGYTLSCAPSGPRLIVAVGKTDGTGAGQGRIMGIYNGALQVDKLFLGPVTTAPVLANSGTPGNVTAGEHRVGYIIQTRAGYVGKICPVDAGGNFNTASVITAPGGEEITMTVNMVWPTEASIVYPVMTTSTNLNRWFIPSQYKDGWAVPGGFAFPVNLILDITDEDLLACSEITDNDSLWTQKPDGTGPFDVAWAAEYGFRTVYGTVIDGVYQMVVSEPSKPQHITADQHVVYLPGFRKHTVGKAINGVFCVFGPNWTYRTSDNGDVPVRWPTPELVDEAIGAPFVNCVAVSASGGVLWVAHTTGLYGFNGSAYTRLPMSDETSDLWRRVNWGAGHTVQVSENPDKKQVAVLVPLDAETVPSAIITFDVTDGVSAEACKVSLWSVLNYAPGAIACVQHPTTKRMEWWLANSAAGNVLRQTNEDDAANHMDATGAINWAYEPVLIPGHGDVWMWTAAQLRVQGSGALAMTAYGPDKVRSFPTAALALATSPAQEHRRLLDLRGEYCSLRFSLNAANEWARLSAVKGFVAPEPWVTWR